MQIEIQYLTVNHNEVVNQKMIVNQQSHETQKKHVNYPVKGVREM